MIFRSGSLTNRVQDYAIQQYTDLIIPGATYTDGAVLYRTEALYELQNRVLGLETVYKPLEVTAGATRLNIPAGDILFVVQPDNLTLDIYRNSVLYGTLTRQESDPYFQVTLLAGTVLLFAVTSSESTVTLTNAFPDTEFGSYSVNGNTIVIPVYVPRLKLSSKGMLYRYKTGQQIDMTYDTFYPGDQLRYISNTDQTEPVGDSYQFSDSFAGVQSRFTSLDTALVRGGLVRTSPALSGMQNPSSTEMMEMGQVSYRLDDSLAVQEFMLKLRASKSACEWTLTVGDVSRTFHVDHSAQQHICGMPFGFALSAAHQGSAAEGLCLTRTSDDARLHVYTVNQGAPSCTVRNPDTGTWEDPQAMSYVIPGGQGTLIDKRFRVRHSAGPYLFSQGSNNAHAVPLILGGALDASPGSFTGMLIAGKLHKYAVVGTALFNSRLNLLIHASTP